MFFQAVRARIGALVSGFGGLLALTAAFTMAYLGYDVLTTDKAVATVTQLSSSCQRHVPAQGGGKRWFWANCDVLDKFEAQGIPVRSKPYAKLSFVGRDGLARTASASFSRLRRTTVQVGDQIAIRYRGLGRPYITTDPPAAYILIGFAALLAGLAMRGLGKAVGSRIAGAKAPAHQARDAQRTKLDHAAQRQAPDAGRFQAPSRAARPPQPRPVRVNAVQRESGWFR